MDKLLLFLTSYSNPQKDAIAATLAWLAEKKGLKFEVYLRQVLQVNIFHLSRQTIILEARLLEVPIASVYIE